MTDPRPLFSIASDMFTAGKAIKAVDLISILARTTAKDALTEAAAETAGEGSGALADAAAACGGGSFTPNTQVVMADGTTKPLDQIQVGDRVEATDPQTGAKSAQTVTAVWINHDTDLMDVTVKTATGTSVVHATQHHLFWDQNRNTWTEADQLTSGDQLHTDNGQAATVTSTVIVPGAADMWDLTVQTTHDFYVVTTNTTAVLVHNCEMLGAGGTQTTSTTLLPDTGQGYWIDVENPAPGVRPGQLHLQSGGNKYLYDYGSGTWVPTSGSAEMSNRLAASVASNPGVAKAISRGATYLNVP